MQVTATIKGYRLAKFLEAKYMPPRFLTPEEEKAEKINLDYADWEAQDALLMAWLLNLMTDAMTNKMTKAKERQLRTQLRAIKKTGLGMSEFQLKIKKIVDALAAIGSPISDHEHIEILLDALPSEYEGFITSYSMKSEVLTINEVESLLLTQEARLEAIQGTTDSISANVTQAKNSSTNFNPAQGTQNSNQGNFRPPFSSNPSTRGGPFRGRGHPSGATHG
ncbi:Retrovirus-related Pol polyprotein from transposon TNT 1-94 [Senna tora]|uniref:Retrovirus-related Pol polyprotein from transposon TNT 1-94 n=1 Tax=Senna tora TaxID=362788 RepID=A0A834SG61_9FABA|nr:Retrovirus-related Pol polyprotein from transposon TNT 1-94 [Senna tora]